MISDDEDRPTSKDLMTFCMQLCHHSQWTSVRVLKCGSNAEIFEYGIEGFYVDLEKLDVDLMFHNTSLSCAFHRSASLPETYTGEIIRIYTDDVHAGYVRLIREKDCMEVELNDLNHLVVLQGGQRHGPALLCTPSRNKVNYDCSLSDPAVEKAMYKIHSHYIDQVCAIHCPYWPAEATEWITRRRSHGFPSKSVIKQCLSYGCDFVQVSYNRLSDDGEWRFSFSKAELLIVKSWSISQKYVYTSLWVINKNMASKNVCTYFFKTLMFWACEEKPVYFWHNDFLVYSVSELLFEMMKWVKSKFCPNYFIPGNNMMDHLSETNLSYEIDALWRASQSNQLITETINECRQMQVQFADMTRHTVSPAWIKRAHIIHEQLNTRFDNYTDLFSTHLTSDLHNALYVELSDIYRGLYFQKKSVSCVSTMDNPSMEDGHKQMYFLKSESYILIAVNLCESQVRIAKDNSSEEFSEFLKEYFISRCTSQSRDAVIDSVEYKRRSISEGQRSLDDQKELKCLLYSRSAEKPGKQFVSDCFSERIIIKRRNVKMIVYTTYKEWPGRSPTVNISWFIAKAYLANLYYTTQRDVSLTTKTCDDIIDVYSQSSLNTHFAERTFPVILSTQLTSIYDKTIQELLGFYSLCSYVIEPSSRSVYLGVCPVLFALYLKLRIAIGQVNDKLIAECSIEYVEHCKICQCKDRNNKFPYFCLISTTQLNVTSV